MKEKVCFILLYVFKTSIVTKKEKDRGQYLGVRFI